MRHSGICLYLFSIFLIALTSCKTPKSSTTEVSKPEIPQVEETKKPEEIIAKQEIVEKDIIKPPLDIAEFRAAWVASVANINWPSKSGLSTKDQQTEAIKILDFLEKHNFNAVIFQARPQADAFYESELEPWSYFLTGRQGQAPNPYYDPLEFWIEESHKRGMELHVWLNPYRAHHTTGGEITETSIVKTKPQTVVKLQNGMWWMDPSNKETQQHSEAVILDIVKRYNIDGLHIDDYFYPYDSYNGGKDFPDDKSWEKYQISGGSLSRGDWRRKSVNDFIERIHKSIKAEKSYVKFGISPFGIWKPGYPQSVKGYDQYEKLYADAKLWLNEGWLDYFSPQLYWKINRPEQSFPELLGWWESENTKNRHLWPGISVGLGGDEKNIDETINQIMISRGMLPQSKGVVHWSVGPLIKSPELSTAILEGPYRRKALVPPSIWLDNESPKSPNVETVVNGDRLHISWSHVDSEDVNKWVLYFKYENGSWDHKILSGDISKFSLQYVVGDKKRLLEKIGITAVDRIGNQSEFIELMLNKNSGTGL